MIEEGDPCTNTDPQITREVRLQFRGANAPDGNPSALAAEARRRGKKTKHIPTTRDWFLGRGRESSLPVEGGAHHVQTSVGLSNDVAGPEFAELKKAVRQVAGAASKNPPSTERTERRARQKRRRGRLPKNIKLQFGSPGRLQGARATEEF